MQRRLFTVHFNVYAAMEYIEKCGAPRTLQDIDHHRLVTFGPNPPMYLRELNWLETAGREEDDPRQPVLRVNNMIAMRTAIAGGAGVGVLPDFVVNGDQNLVRLDVTGDPPQYDLYFVYASELRSSARVQAFRDFMLAKSEAWRY